VEKRKIGVMITAFFNQKGGVGRTTLALHLAGEGSREGKRVALIDADPEVAELLRADLVLILSQLTPCDGWASEDMPKLIEDACIFCPQRVAWLVLNRRVARVGQLVAFADAAQSGRLVAALDDAAPAPREIAALAGWLDRAWPDDGGAAP
jgi:chromosome partitioning protein